VVWEVIGGRNGCVGVGVMAGEGFALAKLPVFAPANGEC
jgi:hypothetical protein